MTHIIYEDKRIELNEGQTVLSALLDEGYEIPNSCRAGVCQSCLMQVTEGEVPPNAQTGLKDTIKAQGYFLACSCQPESPLHIVASKDNALHFDARVIEHKFLNEYVLRLRLKTEQQFDYHAGQFTTLWMNNKVTRSYSLASVSKLDNFLELHIRRIPNGVMSNWLCDEINVADSLQIQAATGECFYVPGSPEQKILLAGTGTGLAPLIGIVRDALSQNHSGEIHLIHGAVQMEELYLNKTLQDMAEQHEQFHYHINLLQAEDSASTNKAVTLDQQLLDIAGSELAESKIYLCGDAPLVNNLKRKMFLGGASMKNIYTDPFVIAADGVNTGNGQT